MITNNRGQTLIEFASLFPVTILFVTALILSLYLFFAVHFIKYMAEETLYCALHSVPAECQRQTTKTLSLLPGFKFENFRTTSDTRQSRVSLDWKFDHSPFPKTGQRIHLRTDKNAFDKKM